MELPQLAGELDQAAEIPGIGRVRYAREVDLQKLAVFGPVRRRVQHGVDIIEQIEREAKQPTPEGIGHELGLGSFEPRKRGQRRVMDPRRKQKLAPAGCLFIEIVLVRYLNVSTRRNRRIGNGSH